MNKVVTVQFGLDEGRQKDDLVAGLVGFVRRRKWCQLGKVDEHCFGGATEEGLLRCPKCGNSDPKFFEATVESEDDYGKVETAANRVVIRKDFADLAAGHSLVVFECSAPLDLGAQTRHKACGAVFSPPEGVEVHVGL